jgi:hypothetical protein
MGSEPLAPMRLGLLIPALCAQIGAMLYLSEQMNTASTLHMYGPPWVKFSISDLQIMLLSMYEFGENFHREGYTFLTGMSQIRFMCVLENLTFLK